MTAPSQQVLPAPATGAASGTTAPGGGATGPAHLAPPAPLSPVARLVAAARASLAVTPGKLRLVAGLAILAALVAAIGAGFAARERSQALAEAQSAAADVVLIQDVRTALVQADATATNAYLNGGLEPVAQQAEYRANITAASRGLAEAAAAATGTQSGEAFSDVNQALAEYTGLVEAARANNRQGFQAGASYLRLASGSLDSRILPALDQLGTDGAEQVEAAYDRAGRAALWLGLAAVVGLGGLVAAQVWLAVRSRRILDVPFAVTSIALALVLGLLALVMVGAQSQANDVRDGPSATADALGRARLAAFDAKGIEALTLINRGSATKDDKDWTAAMDRAETALGDTASAARAELDAYARKHREINALDVAGSWNRAVAASTSTEPDSANAHFTAFATSSRAALVQAAAETSDGLGDARRWLPFAGIAAVLAGLAAAVGAWWGISLRLEEYR